MSAHEVIRDLSDVLQARRVYADPVERGGTLLIPAAQIRGGGGSAHNERQKDGSGMGIYARPIGAFAIRGGKVAWKPAIDWSSVILRTQLIVLVAVAASWALARRSR